MHAANLLVTIENAIIEYVIIVGGFSFQFFIIEMCLIHLEYLRGIKSSYLLDVVPSQRRVITFDFHIKTHRKFTENSKKITLAHTN